ncbi:MAG: glycosyltransferase family 39 protein [Pirellulales bacterium]
MSARNQLVLAAVASLVFFANLGGAHLWDVDEAIFAQTAKEMLQRGDHVVPYFNGELFTHKPAMMYWMMIAGYQMFGPTEFAARFWSAVFGVGSVLLTYHLGRLMFSPRVGFWSGLCLATCVQFNIIARAATPDAYLVFFSALAVLLFVRGTATARIASGTPNERNAPWVGQTVFEPSWPGWALVYAAMACGVLTKGPIGVVLPTATIGLFLLVTRAPVIDYAIGAGWRGALRYMWRWTLNIASPRLFLRTVWSMRPLTAVAMMLLVAGPWYAWVGLRTDGEFLAGFFGVHNFGRFLNAMENHRGPIIYYLVAIAVGFFPWSVFFAPGIVSMRKEMAPASPWRPGYVMVGSWLAVWIGFFSLAGTKLPSYVAPAYPALALFMGAFVDRWLREPATLTRAASRLAWGTVALAGVGMLVALPIVAHAFLNDDWTLALVGLIPLTAAVVGLIYSERGHVRAAAWTMSTMGLLLALAMFGYGAAHVDRYQISSPMAQVIAQATPEGEQPAIGSFHFFRPSLVFYTDHSIEELQGPEEVTAFFAAHPETAFLITTDERIERLASALPPGIAVLDKRPRFLQKGNVLLLGRDKAATAHKPKRDGEAKLPL